MTNLTFLAKITNLLKFKTIFAILMGSVKTSFMDSFDKEQEDNNWSSKPSEDVLTDLKDRVLVLSEKSTNKITGDLKFQILQGLQEREGITEMKQRIKTVFSGSDYEVERIARTEVLYSMNAGSLHANEINGAKWKSWAANIQNKRTGDDSKRLNGQVQRIDDPFIDPDNDKSCQHPPNRPMCRCTCLYYFDKPATIKKHGLDYLA